MKRLTSPGHRASLFLLLALVAIGGCGEERNGAGPARTGTAAGPDRPATLKEFDGGRPGVYALIHRPAQMLELAGGGPALRALLRDRVAEVIREACGIDRASAGPGRPGPAPAGGRCPLGPVLVTTATGRTTCPIHSDPLEVGEPGDPAADREALEAAAADRVVEVLRDAREAHVRFRAGTGAGAGSTADLVLVPGGTGSFLRNLLEAVGVDADRARDLPGALAIRQVGREVRVGSPVTGDRDRGRRPASPPASMPGDSPGGIGGILSPPHLQDPARARPLPASARDAPRRPMEPPPSVAVPPTGRVSPGALVWAWADQAPFRFLEAGEEPGLQVAVDLGEQGLGIARRSISWWVVTLPLPEWLTIQLSGTRYRLRLGYASAADRRTMDRELGTLRAAVQGARRADAFMSESWLRTIRRLDLVLSTSTWELRDEEACLFVEGTWQITPDEWVRASDQVALMARQRRERPEASRCRQQRLELLAAGEMWQLEHQTPPPADLDELVTGGLVATPPRCPAGGTLHLAPDLTVRCTHHPGLISTQGD